MLAVFATVFAMGSITMLTVIVLTEPRKHRPKPEFCETMYSRDGETYLCRQIVAPTCVSGLCRMHCASLRCGCIEEHGL